MTAAMWAILVPAIVALIGSVAGYLRSVAANNNARRAAVNSTNAKFSAASANLAANAAKKAVNDHIAAHAKETDIPPEPTVPGNVYTLPTEPDAS